jgi:hypothetical protein
MGTRYVQTKVIVGLATFLTVVAWSARAQPADATVNDRRPSEAEELQMALRANSVEALRAYLQKYPQTSRRLELLATIAQKRRGEFTEWTIYEIGNQRLPQFVKLSSIRQLGDRVAAETRVPVDPSDPGRKFPERSYHESLIVVDCNRPRLAAAESKVVDPSGKVLFAYKWADPAVLDLSGAASFAPGSIESVTQRILCDEGIRTPLVGKQDLAGMRFTSLAGSVAGDDEILYALTQNEQHGKSREVTVVVQFKPERQLIFSGQAFADGPRYRTRVSRASVECPDGTITEAKSEYLDAANNLIYLESRPTTFNGTGNPLRKVLCNGDDPGK